MRSISYSVLFVLISIFAFSTVVQAGDGKFVEIKVGYANIYKQLDPQSEIIKQAKMGDRLELVYDGTSWYQVKLDKSIGWIEKRSGEVVNGPNKAPVILIILVLLIVGGATGAIVYFLKNKPVTA